MSYSYLKEDYSDLTREDAARQLAQHWVDSEKEKYGDPGLLGTDEDVVVDSLADDIMEGFEMGDALDPRIQLSHYEEENL